jgi:hypothetical protein
MRGITGIRRALTVGALAVVCGSAALSATNADADAAATKKRGLLDRGRTIDPRSLELRGDRLTWTHGGHTRSARI